MARHRAPTGTEDDDAALLGRFVVDEDEEALRDLIARHSPWVHGVCRRILGDAHLADDATQAVFILLVRRARSLENGRHLTGWLHLTARRTAMKIARGEVRRKKRERHPSTEEYLRKREPEDEGREVAAAVKPHLDRALARLSAAQREAVVRHYLLGQSQDDIARNLGCSRQAVQNRVATGLKRLRDLLRGRTGVTVTASLLAAITLPGRAAANEALVATCTSGALAGTGGTGTAAVTAKAVIAGVKLKAASVAVATLAVVAGLGLAPVLLTGDAPRLEVVWASTRGGPAEDIGQAVAVDGAGNIYFGSTADGSFDGEEPRDEGGGRYHMVLTKVDPAGEPLWTRQFAPGILVDVAVDAAGNAFVAGAGSLHRFTPAGEEVWGRDPVGGKDPKRLHAVALAGDGTGIYLVGVAGAIDRRRACLLKVDLDGRLLWRREAGRHVDVARNDRVGVASGADGTVALVYGVNERRARAEAPRRRSLVVVRYDTDGGRTWERRIDGFRRGGTAAIDGAGNVVVLGHRLLASWSPAGEHRWQVPVDARGGFHGRSNLALAGDGSIVVGSSGFVDGEPRAWVTRFRADGTQLWSERVPGALLRQQPFPNRYPGDVAVGGDGRIVLVESVVGEGGDGDVALVLLRETGP